MADFQFVSDQELEQANKSLGTLPEDERVAKLRTWATDLEYQRSKLSGPPVPFKAAAVSALETPASMVEGLKAILPSSADPTIDTVTSAIRSNIDPNWQRQAAEAAAGSLTDPTTWGANIGSMIPMVAEIALLGKVGGKLGGTIGKTVAPAAGFGLQSAGGFLEQGKSSGIDDDILKRKAGSVGVVNAVLGAVPMEAMAGGFANTVAKGDMIPKALKEIGIIGGGGAAMGGVDMVNASALKSAQEEMAARHPDWKPPQEIDPSDPLRSIALGIGTVGLVRGAVHLASKITPEAVMERQRDQLDEMMKQGEVFGKDLESGALARPTTKINIAPTGFESYMELARSSTLSPEQKTMMAEKLSDERITQLATSLGISPKIKDIPIPVSDLRQRVLVKIGGVPEGPRLVESVDAAGQPVRTLVSSVINEPRATEVVYGKRIDDAARAYMKQVPDPDVVAAQAAQRVLASGADITNPQILLEHQIAVTQEMMQAKAEQLRTMRSQALMDAGIPEDISLHPDINPININKKNNKLATMVSRDQLVKYNDSLKSQLTNEYMKDYGNSVARDGVLGKFDAKLFNNLPKMEGIIDVKTGKEIGGMTMEEASSALNMATVLPQPQASILLDNATGARWTEVRRVLSQAVNNIGNTMKQLGKYQMNLWNDGIPKALQVGSGRTRMGELVTYIMQKGDTADAAHTLKQLGIDPEHPAPEHELAQRAITESRVNDNTIMNKLLKRTSEVQYTPEDLIKMANKLAVGHRYPYDWAKRSGMIDEDIYRKHYVPRVQKFFADPKNTIEDWNKYSETVLKGELRGVGLRADQIDAITSIDDTVKRFQSHGITMPKNDPFFEKMREADADNLMHIAREKDPEILTSIYFKAALKKFYLDYLAPGITVHVKNIERSILEAEAKNRTLGLNLNIPKEGIMKMIQDDLDSFLGVAPDSFSRAWNKTNIRSNDNMFTKLMSKGMDGWNKRFGYIHEFPTFVSANDFMSTIPGFYYVKSLGLPNVTSPLKNILTQLPYVSIYGEKETLRGLVRAVNHADKAYAEKLGVLPSDFFPVHGREAGSNRVRLFAEFLMGPFTYSEHLLREAGMGAALERWKSIEPMLKSDPTFKGVTRDEFAKVLLRGVKLSDIGFNEASIQKQLSLSERYSGAYTSVKEQLKPGAIKTAPRGFRAITDPMYELIRKGDMDGAKDLWAQMGAELPNWRYGAGGGIGLFRNPVVRMMTMFYRWPVNNMMFHAWLMNPKNGLMRNEMKIAGSLLAVAGMASALGLKNTYKWVLAGPTPEQVGFGGPIYDDLSRLWKAVMSGADVGAASIVAPPDEQDKVYKRFKQNWDSFERGY